MHRAQIVAVLFISVTSAAPAPKFSGQSALKMTKEIVELGPRPIGSTAHQKMEIYIAGKLKTFGCRVEEDAWVAQTPIGPRPMKNIIATIPGKSGSIVAITGHYDTKLMPGTYFVGANDGGSSAGLLLELARVLCRSSQRDEVRLIWLDGEESTRQQWTGDDNLYGSRRTALRWTSTGISRRVKALINADMVGDRDLVLLEEWNSTQWLRELVWQTAAELGHARHFPRNPGAIEDDHMPFLREGIPALDLIDFEYGPGNSWWHTDRDTVDKLSADSFQVVGDVLVRSIAKLGAK